MNWLLIIWVSVIASSTVTRNAAIGPFKTEAACVEVALAIEAAGHGDVHAACARADITFGVHEQQHAKAGVRTAAFYQYVREYRKRESK